MATYKSYKELKGKTLKYHDEVIICGFNYRVASDHLTINDHYNHEIFDRLALDARSFCTKAYGYICGAGDWPSIKDGDYESLTRCVLWLFQIAEIYYGKEESAEETSIKSKETIKVTRRR